MGSINSILKEIVSKVKPEKEEIESIKIEVEKFLLRLKKEIKSKNIRAEVFTGGSYAKKTMIRKDLYDVDIFVRFYEKGELSDELERILKGWTKYERVHGSRDYFRIKVRENLFYEVVPVKKIRKPEEAENTTDLSYFHVSYVNKKANDKIRDEIVIAKSFCNASHVYGAESYINGFSGYSLELLIIHYKTFMNMLKKMSAIKEKEVVDIEKSYKSKKIALMDINESKLGSPVILVDPTYKQRNALAALSKETFEKFQSAAKSFIKNPSIEAFEIRKTDLKKLKEKAEKRKNDFILLEAETKRQKGDIAGSKLFKFYNYVKNELSRFFNVKETGFNYNKKQSARYFFILENKEKIIVPGPKLKDKKNIIRFRSKHKNIFTKSGKIYARESVNFNAKTFVEKWKKENKKRMEEMSITNIKIVE